MTHKHSKGLYVSHIKKIKQEAEKADISDVILGMVGGLSIAFILWLIVYFF